MYTFKANITNKEHDAFIQGHPLYNLLQTADWAKVKDNWGHEIVGVYKGETLIASASVLIKKLPLGFTMMYIPRGPVLDYSNEQLVNYFMSQLKKWANRYRCVFIKFNPAIVMKQYKIGEEIECSEVSMQALQNIIKAKAKHTGFTTYIEESIQPRFDACVHLDDDFEQQLPRHTKRLIKDALKRNVEVMRVDESGVGNFAKVVMKSEERKQVSLRNEAYFRQLLEIYKDDCYIFLAKVNVKALLEEYEQKQAINEREIADCREGSPKKMRRLLDIQASLQKDCKELEAFKEVEDECIAGILSIKVGDTLEMLYAGMDDTYKKFMPQYHLYTQVMLYAYAHGCKYANMGGVEGDFKDGLTHFKANFNPYIHEFIGEFDLATSPLYSLSAFAFAMRKKILGR